MAKVIRLILHFVLGGFLGMPLGKYIDDELLSAYMDGQLDAAELRLVETALRDDPSVVVRLGQLRGVTERLRLLASVSHPGLPADLSRRVVALCKNSSLVPSGTARVADASGVSTESTASKRPRNRVFWWIAANTAALAAVIALAVFLPKPNRTIEPTGTPLVVENTTPPEPEIEMPFHDESASQLASEQPEGAITLTLVLDLDLSRRAVEQEALNALFEKYGIQLVTGIGSNANIEKEINRLRFTVKDEKEMANLRPAELYLVRASEEVLDAALGEIEADVALYPSYRFDMVFQTPAASLTQAIANSLDGQIAESSSIAVAIDAQVEDQIHQSPFTSIPHQGTLVSSNKRQSSKYDSLEEVPSGGKMSYLLLLVRKL